MADSAPRSSESTSRSGAGRQYQGMSIPDPVGAAKPPPADADLLVAAARDRQAFDAFYRLHVRRVTAFAARRCSNAADVADVVAQTFLHLIGAAERYDPGRAEPAAFVLGIANNVIRDLYRQGSRQLAVASKLAGRDLLDDEEIERIDAAIDAARAAGPAHTALATTPPGEKEVLRLVADGRTTGEAARELGISSDAARARLSRARRRIRNDLAQNPTTTEHDR
jgi:RNA polymerase sigma factor (sigma-70 family)